MKSWPSSSPGCMPWKGQPARLWLRTNRPGMTLRPCPEKAACFGRRSLFLGMAAGVFACESPPVEAPPPGPRIERPTDVIPPDLQLTVRIAAKRLQEALGRGVVERVRSDSQLGTPLSDPLI